MSRRTLLTTVVRDRSTNQEAWVDLWVDPEQLMAELGPKALRSKGKKARMARGAISAHVRRHTIKVVA